MVGRPSGMFTVLGIEGRDRWGCTAAIIPGTWPIGLIERLAHRAVNTRSGPS